jgi:hypothetical protein
MTTWTYMRNTVTGEVIALRRGTPQGRRQLDEMHKLRHPTIWHKPLWEQQFAPPADAA